MKMIAKIISVAAAISSMWCHGASDKPEVVRYNFDNPERFARNWRFYGAKPLVNRTAFFLEKRVSAEDGWVMVIEAKKATGFLFTIPYGVDLKKLPIIRWRWRVVRNLSLSPDEKDPDDQPGVLYLGDGNTWRQYSVGYRWECNSPVGAESFVKSRGGLATIKCFCVRNRNTPEGKWVVEERNVVEDFKAAFGRHPAANFVLCLGANSQNSNSNTRMEIDYIEFRPAPEPEKK